MSHCDYLIVGQGLAGTLLAFELLAAGHKVQLIDDHHRGAASAVAAGVVNPITGRRLVKSWQIDTLLPTAIATYRQVEKLLDRTFLYSTSIHRGLANPDEANTWTTRSGYPDYTDYLSSEILQKAPSGVTPYPAYGVILQSLRVDLPHLVKTAKDYFLQEGILTQSPVDYSKIFLEESSVSYKDITAKKIIFCEGHQVIHNLWFNFVKMVLAKGELLILRIPDLEMDTIYKSKLTYVPLGDHRYWVGATYDWKFENDQPTEKGKAELLRKVNKDLNVPFTIEAHQSAIRPTIKDRRPVLGYHPAHAQLAIFNGLGTKGASLGPYWAKEMSRLLMENRVVEEVVRVARFGR